MPNNIIYEKKSPFTPLYKGIDHKNITATGDEALDNLTKSMNQALSNMEAQLQQDTQTLKASNNGFEAGSTVIDFQKNVLGTIKSQSDYLENDLKIRDREILNTMNYAEYQDQLVEYLKTYLIIIVIGTMLIMGGYSGGLISRYTMEFMMILLVVGVALYFGYLSNQAYLNITPVTVLTSKLGEGLHKIESDITSMAGYLQSEINKFNKNQCAIQNSRFKNL